MMMKRNFKVGRYIGIDVYLHYSWFFIFAFLTLGLATGWFPAEWPGESVVAYWLLGGASALLLYVSVLLHELAHSVMARRNGIKVERITLFFFGGMAGMQEHKMTPKAEFQMAIAGPALSLALSGLFLILYNITPLFYVAAVASYLYRINLILALFNMVPGFPLDGGRVLRSVIWYWTKDFKKATLIAATGGKVFAYILVFIGLANVFGGNFSGMWFALIGFFILMLSKLSYEQVVIKDALIGVKVGSFLVKKYLSVTPTFTVRQALTQFLQKGGEAYPVVKANRFKGLLLFKQLQKLPKKDRGLKVEDVMVSSVNAGVVTTKTAAYPALIKMLKTQLDFLPVVENGKISGIVKREHIARYVKLKEVQEKFEKKGFIVEQET